MTNFATDRKYCPQCEAYVPYLQSAQHAFCVTCDAPLRLFAEPVVPNYLHLFEKLDDVVEEIPRYTNQLIR